MWAAYENGFHDGDLVAPFTGVVLVDTNHVLCSQGQQTQPSAVVQKAAEGRTIHIVTAVLGLRNACSAL
jgi:hypothetical protein